jgi:hypothetical protein
MNDKLKEKLETCKTNSKSRSEVICVIPMPAILAREPLASVTLCDE